MKNVLLPVVLMLGVTTAVITVSSGEQDTKDFNVIVSNNAFGAPVEIRGSESSDDYFHFNVTLENKGGKAISRVTLATLLYPDEAKSGNTTATSTVSQVAERPKPKSGRLVTAEPFEVGLIRIGGHLSCGGYDVQTDGGHTEAASAPPVHR